MSISFGLGSGRRDGGPGILQSGGGMQFQQRHLLYTMNADGLQRRSSLPWVSAFRDFNLYEENSSLCSEEEERHVEKKRRLSVQQVRSLEKSFEVERKLEPERKMQLATELGLQPRQVAVWFQNRRARWKTKQLERDYEHLKQHYNVVLSEKEKLRAEVARLTRELQHAGKQEEEDREPDQHTSISSDCCCSQGTAILITPQNNTEGEQEEDETQIVGADKAEEEELEQAMSPPSFCSDADSNWGQQLLITSSCNNIDIVQSVKNQENREKLETLLYLNSYQQQMGCDLYYNDCPITAEEHQWLSFCSHTKP